MAWNQPGGAGDKDPWGKRKSDQSFDLDKAVRALRNRFRVLAGISKGEGELGGGLGIGLILALVLVVWALSGFYMVQEGERAVVLRFGQKAGVADAGLRWRLPYPIERVEKVNVDKIVPLTIGYNVNPRNNGRIKVPKESLMLTFDENIVDVGFAVQYKVNDAEAYLFNVKDPQATIAQAAEAAVREIVGRSTLDTVLSDEGRSAIARGAQESLQKALDRYRLGVTVVSVDKPITQPPEEVKAAFDDVAKAKREAQVQKTEAETKAREVVASARTATAQQIQEAESYKAVLITRAEGEARRFIQVANEYNKAPAVTREHLYIQMMEQVLTNTTKIFIDQKTGSVIQLPLDKLIPPAEAATSSAAPAESDAASGKSVPNPRGRGEQRNRRVSP